MNHRILFLLLILSPIYLLGQTDNIYNNLKGAYLFSEQSAKYIIVANNYIEAIQRETLSLAEYKQLVNNVSENLMEAGKNLSLAANETYKAQMESETINCYCIESNTLSSISGFYSVISNFSEANESFQLALESNQSKDVMDYVNKGKASMNFSIYQLKNAINNLNSAFEELNKCVTP
jgi:hypothetical protein